MAKENYVSLQGEVIQAPQFNKTRTQARFMMRTLRRNDKIDEPIISVYDPVVLSKIESFKEGDMVQIKGILASIEARKSSICGHCGSKNSAIGTLTTAVAIDVCKLRDETTLEDLKEFSNIVMTIGTVVKDPTFKQLPKSLTSFTSYQIAINRKYHIKNQDVDQKSDYPWVSSFGQQAEEDAKRIQKGSQIFISGGLQTRVVNRNIICENCKSEILSEDMVGEIVPYSVEYLNNCKFDKKDEKDE